jgi:hypothetical protein
MMKLPRLAKRKRRPALRRGKIRKAEGPMKYIRR